MLCLSLDNLCGLREQSGRGIRWLYNGTRPRWCSCCISCAASRRCCCCPCVLIRSCRSAPSNGPSAHWRGHACSWPTVNVPSTYIWGHGNAAPNCSGATIWGSWRSSSNGPGACSWDCRRPTSNGLYVFWGRERRVSVCEGFSIWTRERGPRSFCLIQYNRERGNLDTIPLTNQLLFLCQNRSMYKRLGFGFNIWKMFFCHLHGNQT